MEEEDIGRRYQHCNLLCKLYAHDSMKDKHTFLKHAKHLKEVGLRYDDDLTRLQQKQRQDLSEDFNTLKSNGHHPFYKGSSFKFRHADKTRTCKRDGANRVPNV